MASAAGKRSSPMSARRLESDLTNGSPPVLAGAPIRVTRALARSAASLTSRSMVVTGSPREIPALIEAPSRSPSAWSSAARSSTRLDSSRGTTPT